MYSNRFPATRSAGLKRKPYERIHTHHVMVALSNGDMFTIPSGTYTDMASVPRLLWTVFPPYGYDELAFLVHDHLYTTQKPINEHSESRGYSRLFCDLQMLHFQRRLEISPIRSFLMFAAVRLFGWWSWHFKRNQ